MPEGETMRRWAWWLVAALAVMGCDDGDGGGGAGAAGGEGGAGAAGGVGGAGAAGGAGGAGGGAMVETPQSGLWFANFRLVEVGNLEIAFQFEIEASADQIDRFVLRAIGPARSLSDDLLTATDLPITDGGFTLPATAFVLPAAFSPTGSDVDLELGLSFTVRASDDLCGGLSGSVITIGTDLVDSTFAAVPWGTEPAAPLASCDDAPAEPLPRRMDCPSLVAGRNEGFTSGGLERAFTVFLPTDHDPSVATPVVYLFHGLTSSAETILEYTAMADRVDELGFILIAPESHPDGAIEWDTASAADSPDLAFFDDLQRCVIEELGGDPQRQYTAGLSAGSFQAVYLGLYRAESVAAIAAFSTGLIAPVRQDAPLRPFLTTWGGPDDEAFGQNFQVLTQALNTELRALGHPVVTCDHGEGHTWTTEFTPWALAFLFAHTLGDPLAFDSLPAAFPQYCNILE